MMVVELVLFSLLVAYFFFVVGYWMGLISLAERTRRGCLRLTEESPSVPLYEGEQRKIDGEQQSRLLIS